MAGSVYGPTPRRNPSDDEDSQRIGIRWILGYIVVPAIIAASASAAVAVMRGDLSVSDILGIVGLECPDDDAYDVDDEAGQTIKCPRCGMTMELDENSHKAKNNLK